jgi:HPt (histidine-containing phosphotransfer) domain-containing protein
MEKLIEYTENIPLAAAELYDLSMLEEMEDNEYLIEVLNIFLKDTPVELKDMKDALKTGRTEMIALKAHKIKGSAGVIEAAQLCMLLDKIEKIAKTAIITDTLKNLIEDAQLQYNILGQALRLHIQQLK